jgi:hypothetical protein
MFLTPEITFKESGNIDSSVTEQRCFIVFVESAAKFFETFILTEGQ